MSHFGHLSKDGFTYLIPIIPFGATTVSSPLPTPQFRGGRLPAGQIDGVGEALSFKGLHRDPSCSFPHILIQFAKPTNCLLGFHPKVKMQMARCGLQPFSFWMSLQGPNWGSFHQRGGRDNGVGGSKRQEAAEKGQGDIMKTKHTFPVSLSSSDPSF